MAGMLIYGNEDLDELVLHEGVEAVDTITVENYKIGDIREILSTVSVKPAGAEWVILMPKAEQLEEDAQNVLLKCLEDRDDVMFIMKSTKKLLPTVESRCRVFPREDVTEEEFAEHCRGLTEEMTHALYVFCEADVSTLTNVLADKELLGVLCKFDSTPLEKKKEILGLFSMLKEKDPSSFCELHKGHIKNILLMSVDKIIRGERGNLSVIEEHLYRQGDPRYSASDFFDCLITI